MRKIIQVAVTCLLLTLSPIVSGMTSALSWNDLFGSSANVSTQASDTDYKHPCLRFTDHEYEVCSAYIANASLAVLVPYYKYANTGDGWTRYVTYRLGSRYIGRAHDQIQSRVASWPTGTNEVDAPHIEIMSVTSSLTTNTATLVTKESWRVQSSDRTVLYQEVDQQHVIMMQRVPSYILHKWVVTDVQ